VNGKQGGTFKTEGKLSFLRVFEAGHEVMYYRELSISLAINQRLFVLITRRTRAFASGVQTDYVERADQIDISA